MKKGLFIFICLLLFNGILQAQNGDVETEDL
jgi:hypothetical protein